MKKYGIGMLFLYCIPSNAFIYEVRVLRKWLPQQRYYHYVVGLSDYHDRSVPESHSQRKQILEKLNCCNPKDTKIIIEDLSSRNGNSAFGCQKYFLKSQTGLLASMVQECEQRGFDVENVEYRYCRVIALGPVLHNMHTDPRNVGATQQIKVHDILQEIDTQFKVIHTHTYDKKIKTIIHDQTTAIKKEIELLGITQHADKTIGDYLSVRTGPNNRLEFLKKLLTIDSPLLDIKLITAIIQGQNKKRALIFAGGTHIRKASELLEKIGYKTIYQTPIKLYKETDIRKCHVGSDIVNSSFCIKPLAIQLNVIDKYLK